MLNNNSYSKKRLLKFSNKIINKLNKTKNWYTLIILYNKNIVSYKIKWRNYKKISMKTKILIKICNNKLKLKMRIQLSRFKNMMKREKILKNSNRFVNNKIYNM